MPTSKITVTVPAPLAAEAGKLCTEKDIKLSHLVSEALADKVRSLKEENYVRRINRIFSLPTSVERHRLSVPPSPRKKDLREFPW